MAELGEEEFEREEDERETDSGPMSEEEITSALKAAIDDAEDYVDDELSQDRLLAMEYYRGDGFGNEEEGRSQVVMTEVRDVVLSMMPSLMRIFTASERPVEFAPRRADAIPQAEQATDYVEYVFNVDNPGFSLIYSAIKDALLLKAGILVWGTQEKSDVREEEYPQITAPDLAMLLDSDPTAEIVEMQPVETPQPMMDELTGEMIPVYAVKIRKTIKEKRQYIHSVPPEEFLIARNAQSLDTADYVGRRSLKTLSELVEMGFSREEIEENGNTAGSFDLNAEADTRNPGEHRLLSSGSANSDDTLNRYLYVESYIRIDQDGDGIAELRKICSVGDSPYILYNDLAEDRMVPFAVFCPDPTPHMVVGSSIADQVMDLQRIKSNIMRSTLDSLAQSILPRTGVVEGQVNIDDVLNTENGGIIRMRQPGMVQPLDQPFVGQQSLPLLAYLDDIRAQRTGITKASQGVDPDVLQSTTKAAVTATMSAAQERIELVARIFAETGFKRLFRGLLREIVRNADQPRIVRLRNQWVPVDPKAWDAEMDVVVNVGLGTGNASEKAQLLNLASQSQMALIQMLGPANPIAGLKEYRNTLAQILSLNGFRDSAKYFREVDDAAIQQIMQQQAQAAQKPDPATLLAQVQAKQIEADIAIAQGKAMLEAEKQRADNDLARDKMVSDNFFKAAELEAKYGSQLHIENLYAQIERDNTEAKLVLQAQQQAQAAAQAQQAQQQKAAQAQAAQPPQGGMQ